VRAIHVTSLVLLASAFLVSCASGPTQESSPETGSAIGTSAVGNQSGQKSAAVNDISKSTEVVPALAPISTDGSSDRYKALAQAVRAGQDSQVNIEAAKILGAQPFDAAALNALAMYQMNRGKPGASRLLLMKAVEKTQTSAALYNNLAVAQLQEGDEEAALFNLKKGLRLDEGHVQICANLGAIYLHGGDFAKATPLLDKAYRSLRSQPGVANNYAMSLRAAGRYEDAEKIYSDMIKVHTKDVSLHLNYAILLIDYLKRPKDGLPLVYRVKFLETEKTDIINKANVLELKARSEQK
jgi:Flp pilus assembly protein TadD